MSECYKFLIEKTLTLIHSRITNNLIEVLIEYGHQVKLVDISAFSNPYEYINHINNEQADFYLINNLSSALANHNGNLDNFIFPKVETSIIFIHYDDIFSECNESKNVYLYLKSFIAAKERSYHFCLEYSNFLDLRSLGIRNVFPISHASEFHTLAPLESKNEIDVSFVGHLAAGNDSILDTYLPFSYIFKADYWKRVSSLDTLLEPSSLAFADKMCGNKNDRVDYLANKFFYRAMLHRFSQPFRGEVISKINDQFNISIFGGHPSYLHGNAQDSCVIKENLKYYSPTKNYHDSRKIYANSKINLNITSLQFDSAVINRVIDVGCSGGFILTDWRSELPQVTSVSDEISYRTIDELNSKIEYYLTHEKERKEISTQFHEDVINRFSYSNVVSYILEQLNPMNSKELDPLNVDLGCGSSKPTGFVGVDVCFSPGVDVVADLTKRFPFTDNSVEIVRAHDTVEHLPDRIHTMNEIWRICKPNAVVDIRVPSTDGRGAFQDPTHVSYWNANSFKYYCIEFPPYLDLCHKYGFNGQFSLNSLESIEAEENVIHVHAILTAVKPDKLSTSFLEDLNFGNPNILVLINWKQSDSLLTSNITQLLQFIINHHDFSEAGLFFLLDESDSKEDINLVFSGILMNLFFENDIDEENCPDINFISNLSEQEWALILPNFSCKVIFDDIYKLSVLDDIIEMNLAELSKDF
jgi:spore maturation protein CgeB